MDSAPGSLSPLMGSIDLSFCTKLFIYELIHRNTDPLAVLYDRCVAPDSEKISQ